ncbi:MAG: DegT/DnrJ/EryC1/StrS family aminotransferase [Melioribacteraceae bacterium]|nr:DegT/DnrJ/EryC1/StrS family aminotransferase [Bacteroidales bacterium]MCF8298709.1 DegT/DnrJ/EryC1/StrS family aminotransferase [Saprospiraceae bacterium]MCF8395949.1 DegT/DnrJ/EryC1/StrS family aminotransferase [Melioribacteraceae bacterium]
MDKTIYVTQPALPDLDEFIPYLRKIWQSKRLTNNSLFHQQLEQELADFLGVKYVALFANGTLALLTALQVLRITGEVITTPYSFVATTNSLWWNNLKPVFVDVDPVFGNLDPKRIAEAITPQTTAILPVHVYGNPCQVELIQEIADVYGLKVIYDAAHAFGNNYKGQSIMNWGDLSTLSFHATKPYNTMEGGAIICHDEKTKKRIDYLKNFGFADEVTVMAPGINCKMNEMQAALGLLQLKYHQKNIEKRQIIADIYRNELKDISGIDLLAHSNDLENYNNSYFPVFVNEKVYGKSRDDLYFFLKENGILARRYFYPLISDFPSYRGMESAKSDNLPNAIKMANEVICLPIYPDLDNNQIEKIIDLI